GPGNTNAIGPARGFDLEKLWARWSGSSRVVWTGADPGTYLVNVAITLEGKTDKQGGKAVSAIIHDRNDRYLLDVFSPSTSGLVRVTKRRIANVMLKVTARGERTILFYYVPSIKTANRKNAKASLKMLWDVVSYIKEDPKAGLAVSAAAGGALALATRIRPFG